MIAFSVNSHGQSATNARAKRASASEREGYKAVIFPHHGAGTSSVIYRDATNSTENRERHPRYPVWRGGPEEYLANQ